MIQMEKGGLQASGRRQQVANSMSRLFVMLCLRILIGNDFVFAQGSSSVIHETLDSFDDAFADLKAERDALRQEIENLRIEQRGLIDGAKKRIEEAEEQKDKFMEALETAESKITALEAGKEGLEEKLEDRKIEIDKAQEAVGVNMSSLEELKTGNAQLTMRWNEAERALEKAAARIQKLQADKESLEAELETMRQERKKILFGYDDELVAIRQQRQDLLSKLEAAEEKLKAAAARAAETDKQEEALKEEHRAELTDLVKARSNMEEKLGRTKAESAALLKQHKEEVAKISERAKAAERKLGDAEDKSKMAEQESALLREKMHFYENAAAQAEKAKEDIEKKLKEENAASVKALDVLRERVKVLEEKLKFAEDKLRFSEEKGRVAEEKFGLARQDLEGAARKAQELTLALASSDAKLKAAEQKLAKAREESAFSDERSKNLQEQISEAQKQLGSLSQERKGQEELLRTKEERLSAVEKQLAEAEEKIRRFAAEQENTGRSYNETIDRMKADLRKSEEGARAAAEEAGKQREQSAAAEEKIRALESKLAAAEDAARSLSQEREEERAASVSLQEAAAKERAERETLVSRADAFKAEAQKREEAWRLEKDSLEAKNQELEKSAGAGRETLAAVEAQLSSVREDYRKFYASSQTESENLEAEKTRLAEELYQAQGEVQTLQEYLASVKRSAESDKERLKALEERIVYFTAIKADALKEREAESLRLGEELKAAQAEIAGLRSAKNEASAKIDELTNRLLHSHQALTKSAALEKENKLLRGGMDNLLKALKEAEARAHEATQNYEKNMQEGEAIRTDYTQKLAVFEQAEELKAQSDGLLETLKNQDEKFKKLMDSFLRLQKENEQLKEDAQAHINPREFAETRKTNSELEKENAALKKDLKEITQSYAALKEEHAGIAKDSILQQQKIRRMDSHLKEWSSEKEGWAKGEGEKRDVLSKKTEEIGGLRGELRKALDENRRLQKQLESFPGDLSAMSAKMRKIETENALLHYNLGVIYTEREMYEEAVTEFEKTLERKPDDPEAHYNLGIIYSQYLLDENKAIKHFTAYIKRSPNDKDADHARRYLFTRESYAGTTK